MEFFVPGRTEIIGNHTDHQLGRVIAAAVKPGVRACAEKVRGNRIFIKSSGFGEIEIDSRDLSPRESEKGTATALVRGMAFAMRESGMSVGAFRAEVCSELKAGGGLSSSAAFTVLVGNIINAFFNDTAAGTSAIAGCARKAENLHFGKPSGLMDQLVCATGGTVYIDFMSGEISRVEGRFRDMGLTLCLTDTGGSHENLTEAYAAIPGDMSREARRLGKEYLGQVDPVQFFAAASRDDRQYLRAVHFFEENRRVPLMKRAMEEGNGEECMRLMNESGRSSEEKLKNIRAFSGDGRLEQGLALSRKALNGIGAWRVHGGGFAGCVQALMPEEVFPEYRNVMEPVFGKGSCLEIM